MADYDGCLHDGTVSAFGGAERSGVNGCLHDGTVSAICSSECVGRAGYLYWFPDGPPPPIQHYRMRAWNLTTVDWEVWTSTVTPNVTPPSGNPVIGVTVVGIWEA